MVRNTMLERVGRRRKARAGRDVIPSEATLVLCACCVCCVARYQGEVQVGWKVDGEGELRAMIWLRPWGSLPRCPLEILSTACRPHAHLRSLPSRDDGEIE